VAHYLLTLYQPDGGTPAPDDLARIMADLDAIEADLRAQGSWVFSGGLHPPHATTVVQARADADSLVSDGPYLEGREHVGGFTVVDVPDLDEALRWADRMSAATTLPVEVRPFAPR